MTIDVNDWPLDPYTVDGVELAARLNKVIPSEINALISGKANLAGSNFWTGTQVYQGTSLRFMADFTSVPAGCYAFQTSTTNAATHVTAMPNGGNTTSSFRALNASSGNAGSCYIAALSTECQLVAGVVGSGTALPLVVYCGGLNRMSLLPADGRVTFRSEWSGYCGGLQLCNQTGSSARTFRVNTAANGLEVLNASQTVVTHTFHNAGGFSTSGGPLTVYGMGSGGGGSANFSASRDGSGNNFATVTENNSGSSAVLGIYPALASMWGPNSDAGLYSGFTFARWAAVYAVQGTINTSDAREKTPLRPFTPEETACAMALVDNIGVYQWLHEINEKGESAPLRAGIIAQQLEALMAQHGLDPLKYGMLVHDFWPAFEATYQDKEVPVLDENGEPKLTEEGLPITEVVQVEVTPARPAGDRYSVIYSEISLFIERGLRENQKLLEARIAALEAKP